MGEREEGALAVAEHVIRPQRSATMTTLSLDSSAPVLPFLPSGEGMPEGQARSGEDLLSQNSSPACSVTSERGTEPNDGQGMYAVLPKSVLATCHRSTSGRAAPASLEGWTTLLVSSIWPRVPVLSVKRCHEFSSAKVPVDAERADRRSRVESPADAEAVVVSSLRDTDCRRDQPSAACSTDIAARHCDCGALYILLVLYIHRSRLLSTDLSHSSRARSCAARSHFAFRRGSALAARGLWNSNQLL